MGTHEELLRALGDIRAALQRLQFHGMTCAEVIARRKRMRWRLLRLRASRERHCNR